MRSSVGLLAICDVAMAGCQAEAAPFNPDDPAVIAQVDSVMQRRSIDSRKRPVHACRDAAKW